MSHRRSTHERRAPIFPEISIAPECVLALHNPRDHVAVLVRNRTRRQTVQRILPRETIAGFPFQAWLQEQNEAGATLLLEGKKNLLRLLQDIPLTEAEAIAVVDGVNALEKLPAQLSDVPTPEGSTPRQLQTGLVQIQPTKEGSK